MPVITADDIYRKTDSKTNHAMRKDEPIETKNENPSTDFNNDRCLNSNEEISLGDPESTDGLGSTRENEQPKEDDLGLIEYEQPNEDYLGSTKVLNLLETAVFGDWTVGKFITLLGIMIFGYHNTDKCPGNVYIPYMVILIGLLSFTMLFYAGMKTNSLIFDCIKKNKQMALKISLVLFVCVWIVEVALFTFTDVSYDSSADNYCDRAFCTITTFINTYIVLGVGAVLYLLSRDPDFNRTSREIPRSAYRLFPFESDSDSDSSESLAI